MESSLYVAAAAQRNLEKQLIVVANNIANANTVGFRAESVDFNSLVSVTGSEPVHFPVVAGLRASTEQGEHVSTGNPFDIAISGDGYLSISTPAGNAYTRDGRMQMSAFGELLTLEGNAVLDNGQAPIQLDPNAGEPTIHPDGRIEQNGRLVASIGLFNVPRETLTERYSNSAFFSNVAGTPITPGDGASLTQGYVEASNVNPMREIAHLMTISKSFESATAMIDRADETISRSISELGSR